MLYEPHHTRYNPSQNGHKGENIKKILQELIYRALETGTKKIFLNFRSEHSQGAAGDDTAGNNIGLYCYLMTWEYGDGLSWGSWSNEVNCPSKNFS